VERLNSVVNRKSAGLGNALISGYNYGYTDALHKESRSYVEQQVGSNPLQRINYSYDDVDQLLGEVSTETTPKLSKTYTYDPMGNRLTSGDSSQGVTASSTSYTHNNVNQLSSLVTTPQGGSSVTSTFVYDQRGNMTSSPGTTYTYDGNNRLTSVVQSNPATGVNISKSEYVYDFAARKVISKKFSYNTTISSWTPVSEKRRVYDGMDVVQERDGSNALVANLTRDGNIGGLLARTTTAGHFFYHYDGAGNVVQWSDSGQTAVAEYSYDAYGNTLSMSGEQASGNPYSSPSHYHPFRRRRATWHSSPMLPTIC
jgi:hypothetical protein